MEDTKEFPDDKGNKLVCVSRITGPQWGLLVERAENHEYEVAKRLGVDIDAEREKREKAKATTKAKKTKDKKPEDETSYLDITSPEINLFKFRTIAVSLKIGKEKIEDLSDLEDAYNRLNPESMAWIDSQVDSIWRASEVKEAEKN